MIFWCVFEGLTDLVFIIWADDPKSSWLDNAMEKMLRMC